MVGDRDILEFRAGYYGLCVSMLWREPSAEVLAALGRDIEAREAGAQALHPELGEGWRQVARALAAPPAGGLQDAAAEEYTRLFIGPGRPEVSPYESHYLAGRLLDRPLVRLRATLGELGIVKEPSYPEPEDFIAFELDVVRRLLARQRAAGDPGAEARCLDDQARFLKRHLLVWGPAAAADLARAPGARLYRGVARVLAGFLEIERSLLAPWGDEALRTLADARRDYSAGPEWAGPLFDPAPPRGGQGPA